VSYVRPEVDIAPLLEALADVVDDKSIVCSDLRFTADQHLDQPEGPSIVSLEFQASIRLERFWQLLRDAYKEHNGDPLLFAPEPITVTEVES
jgi:hypothetical protein